MHKQCTALNRKGYSGYICFLSTGLSGEYGVETSAYMLSARVLHTSSMGTDDELIVYRERQELRSKCLDRLLLTHVTYTI